MFNKATVLAIAVGAASPAFASDQLAQAAGVEPGMYTLAEVAQIMSYGGSERATRIELIHDQRAAFDEAVRQAVANGQPGVGSSRSPRQ